MNQNSFHKPDKRFFELPHTWFELSRTMFRDEGNKRRAIVMILQYLIKFDWILISIKKPGLTTTDIYKGFYSSGRKRLDGGTGLDYRSIKKALEKLVSKDLVEIINREGKDYFRINKKHDFFKVEKDNHFPVPNNWTNMCKNTKSGCTVEVVEYLFRHAWGNSNDSHVWLEADEFVRGRLDITGNRVDNGLGYDYQTICRALNEAIALGWVIWTDHHYDDSARRLFNLKLDGFTSAVDEKNFGRFLGELPWESNYDEDESFTDAPTNRTDTPTNRTDTPTDRTDAPTNRTDAPTNRTDAPTDLTNAPTNRTDAPTDRTDTPRDRRDAPTSKGNDASKSPTDAEQLDTVVGDQVTDVSKSPMDAGKSTVNKDNYLINFLNNKLINIINNNLQESFFDQSMCNVIVGSNQKEFLASIGITGSITNEILDLKPPDEMVFGWVLYKFSAPILRDDNRLGIIISKLRYQQKLPYEYLILSKMSIQGWINLYQRFSNPNNKYLSHLEINCSNKEQEVFQKIFDYSVNERLPEVLKQLLIKLIELQEDEEHYE